jgi:hypothetical protein
MTWSFDITTAPLGEWIHSTETREVKGKEPILVETKEYAHEWVWLWTKCGKKVRTRWLPPSRFSKDGRWDGLATGEVPLAWHPYIVPADPVFPTGERAVEPLIVHRHEFLDDCGSGA